MVINEAYHWTPEWVKWIGKITDPPKWGEVNWENYGTIWVYMTAEFAEQRQKFQNSDRIGRIAGTGWNTVEFVEFDPPIGTTIPVPYDLSHDWS